MKLPSVLSGWPPILIVVPSNTVHVSICMLAGWLFWCRYPFVDSAESFLLGDVGKSFVGLFRSHFTVYFCSILWIFTGWECKLSPGDDCVCFIGVGFKLSDLSDKFSPAFSLCECSVRTYPSFLMRITWRILIHVKSFFFEWVLP